MCAHRWAHGACAETTVMHVCRACCGDVCGPQALGVPAEPPPLRSLGPWPHCSGLQVARSHGNPMPPQGFWCLQKTHYPLRWTVNLQSSCPWWWRDVPSAQVPVNIVLSYMYNAWEKHICHTVQTHRSGDNGHPNETGKKKKLLLISITALLQCSHAAELNRIVHCCGFSSFSGLCNCHHSRLEHSCLSKRHPVPFQAHVPSPPTSQSVDWLAVGSSQKRNRVLCSSCGWLLLSTMLSEFINLALHLSALHSFLFFAEEYSVLWMYHHPLMSWWAFGLLVFLF